MDENKLNEQSQNNNTEETSTPAQEINYQDLYIKLAADFQNFKRRLEKERSDWTETAQGMILSVFFPILEDFDRALDVVEKTLNENNESEISKTHIDGFTLIQKNIKKTLIDLGVHEIDTIGEFNPEYHEALTQVASPNHQSGHIVQVFSKGYLFKGKVIKHAQVSVAQ